MQKTPPAGPKPNEIQPNSAPQKATNNTSSTARPSEGETRSMKSPAMDAGCRDNSSSSARRRKAAPPPRGDVTPGSLERSPPILEQSREAHFEPLRRRWLLVSGLAVCHRRSSGMERIRPSLGQGLVTFLQERAQLDRLVVLRPHLKSEPPPSGRRDLDDV